MFYFHPIHKKCRKLVLSKIGLKNNWMKKLDHVNRPLTDRCTIKIFYRGKSNGEN